MNHDDADLNRLAELRAATESLSPGDGFTEWILECVQRERAQPLWRVGRLLLVAFALAAAGAMVLSSLVQSRLDERALTAFDSVELER